MTQIKIITHQVDWNFSVISRVVVRHKDLKYTVEIKESKTSKTLFDFINNKIINETCKRFNHNIKNEKEE